MSEQAPWEVGQEVFVVPRDCQFRHPYRTKITKVGRKWAHIERGGRFDINTGVLDSGGYGARERAWRSESEYLREKNLDDRWSAIKRAVMDAHSRPKALTPDDLATLESVLGVRPD